jgi:uncharacterized membrane protein
MTDATQIAPSPPPRIGRVGLGDIAAALKAGLRDFARAPAFGLFFASFYVAGGILIYLQLGVLDQSYWIIPVALGFPLLAPFLAVGLYEVSRRLEIGEPLDWAAVLGVIFRQKDRQFPSIAMVIIMVFMFWVFVAHLVFALFMGLEPMTNILSNWQDTLLTRNGLTMLAVGTAAGAVLAFVLFSLTVASLPLLLDRELDFITAMIASFQLVLANPLPMIAWGLIISALMLVAMLPLFLGLFLVLPVLGHATWHLYRRSMSFDA